MSPQIHSGTSLLGNVALPDRYRIVHRIAGGGMATVWCAEDVLLGRRVAIKLLGEQFAYDESAGRRLEREARAAGRLSGHRHVVTIYDVSHSEPDGEAGSGRPFIVMEHRYALAVVAFELLVGERPFTAEHFAAQARQHIDQQPPRASHRNRNLTAAVDVVLARGMAKGAPERWDTATAFADAIASTTGGSQAPKRALTHAASHSTPGPAAARRPARRPNPIPAARPPGPVHPTAPAATPAPASATPPPSADALEARGHALMLSGSYTAAVDVLRQAIAAAEPGSLTDAYALFDMGRSLRLAGDPAAAVILEKRLQIPNQTGVVRHELELALRALGAAAQASGGATPGPGHHPV